MIPNIQRWATKYLKNGTDCWNVETWGDLKDEFNNVFIFPQNCTLNLNTCEEVTRYAETAMLCINFLESVESLCVEGLSDDVILKERDWLYKCIFQEVEECLFELDKEGFGCSFPNVLVRIKKILSVPYLYAYNDWRAIKNAHCVSTTKH